MSTTAIEPRDITGDIGPLANYDFRANAPYKMYSFDRPASILWQAVYEGLTARGLSHKKAVEWLQSKAPRWALDDDLGEAIRLLGSAYAAKADLSY